ncbi:MAG: hypothetical protein ACTHOF_12860 [Flavisolibacter sp.]|jgi:hypothetical protein
MSNTFKDKLLQYAPEPPQKTWDEIAKSLDSATPILSNKLYQFETAPPAGVWDRINNKLNNNQAAKIVPFFQKQKNVLRYAAAAAILLLVVVAAVFFNQKEEMGNIAINVPTEQQSKKNNINADASVPDLGSKNTLMAETKTDKNNILKNFEEQSQLHHLPSQTQLGSVEIAKNFIPETAEQKQTVNAAAAIEKYMVYSDDDGNAMKLPKKLFDFVSCVKENILCKEEMMQLQEKFATADFSNDFTGVLEMLKNLKENQ